MIGLEIVATFLVVTVVSLLAMVAAVLEECLKEGFEKGLHAEEKAEDGELLFGIATGTFKVPLTEFKNGFPVPNPRARLIGPPKFENLVLA